MMLVDGELDGTGALIRHSLRRDRIFWPAWLGLLAIQLIATASSYESLYPTEASRAELMRTIGTNRSLVALYGPAFDLSSAGGFTAWRIYGFSLIMAGLMSIMAVVRHTRAEEEAGRLELLRAGVVGRHAPLAAALAVTMAANALLGAISFGGMLALGQSAVGAGNMAVGFTLVGAVFAGIAAVTAQIPENARPARGMAVAVLALAFILRALGDSSNAVPWMSWLSPVGWAQQSRPYAGERWWTLSIPLVVAAVLVVVAFVLESRRDFASGLRPTRLGPAVASPRLGSAAGLAWRLLRGSWVAWVLGIAVFSAVLGTVAKGVLDIFKDNPELEKIFREMGGSTGTVVDALFAALLPVVGMIATVHAVTIVLRIRTEEVDLRAEQVLATATTRPRMYVSYVAHAVVSPFVLMVIAGASAGGAYAVTVHDSSQVLRVTGAAFATVPAMLVVIGLAAALVGFLPQNAPVIWAVLGYSVAVGQVGPLLKFPTWALKTSPFGNIPPLPGSHVSAAPILVMSSVGVVLLVLGLVGFRRRDIG